MSALKLETLSNTSIELALPLWKNYNTLSASLKKNFKGASILLDWITSVVEWRLKNETMKSLEMRFPDFQKQVLNQLNLIAQLKAHIIEQEQSRTKLSQGSFADNNRSQGRLEYKISSPIARKTGDLEDFFSNHKSPTNAEPLKTREENFILQTDASSSTQRLTNRRQIQTEPNTYGHHKISEEDISDSSIFLDLDINSSEKITPFKQVLKPKPKVITESKKEDSSAKNSLIILNNLKMNADGIRETFIEDPFGNNPKNNNLDGYNQEIKDLMKVVLSPTSKSNDNPQNLRKLQEINNEYKRPPLVDGSNETIICCGKSFHNRFFCA